MEMRGFANLRQKLFPLGFLSWPRRSNESSFLISSNAHLVDQNRFEYDHAKPKFYGLFYEYVIEVNTTEPNDGIYHFAVGTPDWMPLMLAACVMGHHSNLIDSYLFPRLYLDADSILVRDWKYANEGVFLEFTDNVGLSKLKNSETNSPISNDAAIFLRLPAYCANIEFERAIQLAYPVTSHTVTHVNPEHSNYLQQSPVCKLLDQNRIHFESIVGCLPTWFSQRGFKIDFSQQLVYAKGYQPLYHVLHQS